LLQTSYTEYGKMDILSLFNQQIILYQDDAYTLAWYLLGDAPQAEAILLAAVQAAFAYFSPNRMDCRLLIFKQVVGQYQRREPAPRASVEPGILRDLQFLHQHKRVVVVLVDILGLPYSEAAYLTNRPREQIGCLLAQARWQMTEQRKFAVP
jgi:hypothetical protein